MRDRNLAGTRHNNGTSLLFDSQYTAILQFPFVISYVIELKLVRMLNLDKKWLKAKGNMDKELAKKLLTMSFGTSVTDTLSNFDWDGKPIATVGLEFTPDNRRVARGQFILHGLFTKEPVMLQASKLFPEADPDITLTVVIPDGREFRFNGGTLGSDLLACENFKHHFRS